MNQKGQCKFFFFVTERLSSVIVVVVNHSLKIKICFSFWNNSLDDYNYATNVTGITTLIAYFASHSIKMPIIDYRSWMQLRRIRLILNIEYTKGYNVYSEHLLYDSIDGNACFQIRLGGCFQIGQNKKKTFGFFVFNLKRNSLLN